MPNPYGQSNKRKYSPGVSLVSNNDILELCLCFQIYMHVLIKEKKNLKINEKKKNRAYTWSKLWIFPQHAFNEPSTEKRKKTQKTG